MFPQISSASVALVAATLWIGCSAPPDKAALTRLGDELFTAEKYSESVSAYQQAVSADPRDGHLRLKLAKAYWRTSKWTAAADSAMRAADLMPDDPETQLLAADYILAQGRYDDALAMASKQLRRDPDNVRILTLWANATARLLNSTWSLYRLGDTGGVGKSYEVKLVDLRPRVAVDRDRAAEAALRKARQIAGDSTDAKLALVNFLWGVGRPEQAEEILKELADAMPAFGLLNHSLGAYYLARGRGAEGEKYLMNATQTGAPDNHAPRVALADYYLESNRDEEALAIYMKMAAEGSLSNELLVKSARASERLGRRGEALERINSLLSRLPKHGPALAIKTRLLASMGNPSEALTSARAAVAAAPTSSDSHAALGHVLQLTGDPSGAFAEFAEALRLDPSAPELPALLARLGLAIGHDRAALDFARQAARRDPDNVEVGVMVVKALIRVRDYDAAGFALKPLIARNPQNSELQAQSAVLMAVRAENAAARIAFERALKSNPTLFDAIEGLVSLDLEQQQLSAARQRVDRALAARPDDVALMQLASRVFRAEDNFQRAETILRRALDLEPGNVTAALLLVDGLSARNRREEAMQLLGGVLTRQPSSVAAQTVHAVLLEQMGRTDEARARYEKIVANNPSAATAASRLALLSVDRNENLDVTLAFMTEAKRSAPNDPEVSDAIGWVYLHKNLIPLAMPHLEDAVRGNPRNAAFQYHLGAGYVRAGQLEKARQAFTRALGLDSNFAERSKAQTALASLPR